MQSIRKSSEAEIVLEFLKMEWTSVRFEKQLRASMETIGVGEELLFCADLNDSHENSLRRRLLGDFRGYGQNRALFENFPLNLSWTLMRFDAEDLARLRYIRYDYWDVLSGGTGRPLDAAENIRRGITVFDVPNDGFQAAAQALDRGVRFPPLIALCASAAPSDIFLVEGHLRATAYALRPKAFPGTLCYIGACPKAEIDHWRGGA